MEINGYKVIELLGKGSYGKVLKVEKEGRYYALKKITSSKREIIPLLEIYICMNNKHPNLIQGKEFFYYNNKLYLVLELAQCTLYDYPRKNLHKQECLKLLYDLLSAVEYLHDNGFQHRDIHWHNCLMINNQLKLADFSLTSFDKFASGPAHGIAFSCPQIVGIYLEKSIPSKYRYLFDQKTNYFHADVWACGIIFFYILTGESLFGWSYDDVHELLFSYLENPRSHLSKYIKDEETKSLLLILLEPDTTKNIPLKEILKLPVFGNFPPEEVENLPVEILPLEPIEDWRFDIVINWMKEVFSKFDTNIYTQNATINLIYHLYNKITEKGRIRKKIQCLAITCYLLMSKIYDQGNFDVELASYMTAYSCSEKKIMKMEREILRYIAAKIMFVTFTTLTNSEKVLHQAMPILMEKEKYYKINMRDYIKNLEDITENKDKKIEIGTCYNWERNVMLVRD